MQDWKRRDTDKGFPSPIPWVKDGGDNNYHPDGTSKRGKESSRNNSNELWSSDLPKHPNEHVRGGMLTVHDFLLQETPILRLVWEVTQMLNNIFYTAISSGIG